MQNFEKIIKLLLDNEVEFILIGGFAAAVHGSTILTHDIDVCVPFNLKNAARILNAFKDHHPLFRDNKRPVDITAERLSEFKNLYLITDLGAIDFLGSVSGFGRFEKLTKHTIEIDLFGRKCMVLDIESLIKSKKEMAREKDKQVVIQLMAIKEKLGK